MAGPNRNSIIGSIVRRKRRCRKSCRSMTHWGTDMAVPSCCDIVIAAAVDVAASKSNDRSEDAMMKMMHGRDDYCVLS